MITDTARFKEYLKKKGYFATRQRVDLFNLLQKRDALAIPQLLALLPRQNQSTVYRNINVFEELGIINKLKLGWHSKLELSDVFQHHHHHLTCNNCGRIINLPENSAIENAITSLSSSQNFQPTDHQLEIRGLCQTCSP